MKKARLILFVGCLIYFSIGAVSVKQQPVQINYVPNETTAVKIAEAIWVGVWGEEKVNKSKPIKATLTDGIWHVVGTMPPTATKGGTMHMTLQASDCKIIDVWGDK